MDQLYSRTFLLLGDDLKFIQKSHVMIIGLGAVGSYAAEAIARAGVGRLTLVDFDTVRPSNLNRQLYALHSTLNQYKVDVAIERIKDINPDCDIQGRKVFVKKETLPGLLSERPDCVIDAIDTIANKCNLLEYLVNHGIHVVSSMGAGSKIDLSMLQVGDISKTKGCALAKNIRYRLRKRGIKRGIRCVYSEEEKMQKGHSIEEDNVNKVEFETSIPKSPVGSISFMTGSFGLRVAGEVIKYLLNQGEKTYQSKVEKKASL